MAEAPDRVHLCTKGAVASDFKQGVIFGTQEASEAVGTVEYIRADLVRSLHDKSEPIQG